MKKMLTLAAALFAAALAVPAAPASAQTLGINDGCLTHTIFGVPLEEPMCSTSPGSKFQSSFRDSLNYPQPPVDPVDPAPVDPVDPVEPGEPDPVCTTIPGAPIYGDRPITGYEQVPVYENQQVGTENGDPIYERRIKYKTITIPGLGTIRIPDGFENVIVGYEQVPVYDDVLVGYEDGAPIYGDAPVVGYEPDEEVCEEPAA